MALIEQVTDFPESSLSAAQEMAVEISNLSMSFNGHDDILKNISLNIPKGQITIIIGFSGAGKSVLLKLILGLLKPTSGSVKVFGQDIVTMDSRKLTEFRRHFGLLFQDAALFDDKTAIENVMFPLREHRRDLTEKEMFVVAHERLKQVGLEEIHFEKQPSELSGGMRKRVGLARALALDPEILVYDEPTTGLDPVLSKVVNHLIVTTENLKKGTTSIVVSHDIFGAFEMADRIVMLDAGRILLNGTPEDFCKSEIDLVKQFVPKGFHLNAKKQEMK